MGEGGLEFLRPHKVGASLSGGNAKGRDEEEEHGWGRKSLCSPYS